MESNDNLEQLLRQMYAQESHHDEDIDTSDIIDEEWTKFEAEHFKDGRNSNSSILHFFHSTKKIAALRVFDDENHVMNRDIMDVQGEILVISQFTLFASYKKGNRPSYLRAGSHEVTIPLYEQFKAALAALIGHPIPSGVFGAEMQVALVNDGPVTICMDTKNKE